MNELDHIWSKMLADASQNASNTGRQHVVEYLRLRATNDAIRMAGVSWLFDTFIELAGQAVRKHAAITIEREEPHSFKHGSSTMVGSLVRVRQGVRCLTVEAGWARTPSDGIMRNGALAFARITHFGMPKAGTAIRFVHGDDLPQWLDPNDVAVDASMLSSHFETLLRH